MTFPFCNQADLFKAGPRVTYERRHFDSDGNERTERRVGAMKCPKCRLWWPAIEEPDCWYEGENNRWIASGWWGGVVCQFCGLLLLEQPDGTVEGYQL